MMLHCLAYGNSDQASFRDEQIRRTFDILTVPSTIASYYPDATAAFVLSSTLDYMIEPRTPLFQEVLAEPRASHYTLGSLMGDSVSKRLGDGGSVVFPASFYTSAVCDQMVSSMIEFQRSYGGRAETIVVKLDRYRQLLEEATGEVQSRDLSESTRPPAIVLCPYFAARSRSDPWWGTMERIWAAALEASDPREISAVVAMSDLGGLRDSIDQVPKEMSSRVFFWIPGFDERRVSSEKLRSLKEMIIGSGTDKSLMNLYGGYYSILLGKLGLAGFNNGLGYSESRDWPTLDATGAAPARYYVRRLHAFVSGATARVLIEEDSEFACDCVVCVDNPSSPNQLDYHSLKKHFALARAWEIQQCDSLELSELCVRLRDDCRRADRLRSALPAGVRIPFEHLSRWATALEP